MAATSATVASRRQDGFDALRVAAALTVIYWHSYPLTGNPAPIVPLLGRTGAHYGSIAVGTFFAMSGYLVASSWRRRPDAVRFLRNRLLRVYPALIACVLLTVVVLSAGSNSREFWMDPLTRNYLVGNATLYRVQYFLPGLFTANPYGGAVNGSLWTLPYEVVAYIAILVVGVLGGLRTFQRALVLTATGLVAFVVFVEPGAQTVPRLIGRVLAEIDLDPKQTLVFASFFLCGVACAAAGSRLYAYRAWILLTAGALLLGGSLSRFELGLNVGLALLVVSVGTFESAIVRGLRAFGDPSYGTYLYAFPLQQALAAVGVRDPALMFALAAPLSLAAGYLSWHLVERHALRWSKRPV